MDEDLYKGFQLNLEANALMGFIFSALVALICWDQTLKVRFQVLSLMVFCIFVGWLFDSYLLKRYHTKGI